mmetsp:Transcript_16990/g.47403  ORF Transcript_16990/g.47403 Transcript_16990/m.47403 type:complete len:99 (-) Transcript_16990:58-354(-)
MVGTSPGPPLPDRHLFSACSGNAGLGFARFFLSLLPSQSPHPHPKKLALIDGMTHSLDCAPFLPIAFSLLFLGVLRPPPDPSSQLPSLLAKLRCNALP